MRLYFLFAALLTSNSLATSTAVAQTRVASDTLSWGGLSTDHSLLQRARQTAELPLLAPSTGLFTVLTPTNTAFDQLPAGTLDELLLPANRASLRRLLNYHILIGRHDLTTVASGQRLPTLQGQTVQVQKQGNRIFLQDAQGHLIEVQPTPRTKTNGLRYSVQGVLLPSE